MKKRFKIWNVLGIISILAVISSCDSFSKTEIKAATPVINETTEDELTTVTITCETEDVEIYYSIDGGEEVKYEDAIVLKADTSEKTYTIKAVAKKDGYTDSDYATKEITVAVQTVVIQTVTVTFKNDETVIASEEVELGSTIEAPETPAKTGYTFAGWYNGETEYDEENVYTEDTIYTAKWTVITYTITYDVGEGTNAASNPTTYTIESDNITLEAATGPESKPKFVAWHAEKADGDAVIGVAIAKGSTGNKTFVAEYTEKNTYTVTYYNGETSVGTETVTEGEKAAGSAIAQKGYDFDGWYTDKDLTEKAAFDSELTGSISLYGKWIKRITVIFKDGDTEVDSKEISNGATAEAAAAPAKTGYTFDGWYNGETEYDEETAYTEDTTYTAKWTVITYTITYDVGDGTNASNPETYTVESDDITLADPTGPDATPVFVAWHAEKADGDAVSGVAIAKGSTGDKKFVAEYRAKKTYTVTYYNGETSVGTETVIEGEKAAGSAIAQEGYKFDGWYTDKDLTTAADFDTVLTGDLSLYGKWHEVGTPAITITYSASDIKVTASEADADGKITLTASSDYSNYKWVYNDEIVGTKNVLEVTHATAGTYIYELTAEKDNETYSACVYVVIK